MSGSLDSIFPPFVDVETDARNGIVALPQRLAAGLIPLDAVRNAVVSAPLRVALDSEPADLNPAGPRVTRPAIERHASCRFVLRFQPGVGDAAAIRLYDSERRFVPRRLRLPVAQTATAAQRTFQPALFPGAAYEAAGGATVVRGRVTRDGAPVRWTRVEARRNGRVVGRAHGDDRGDFLLMLETGAPPAGPLAAVWPDVSFSVFFHPNPPAADPPPGKPGHDPLWDLPLEDAAAAGAQAGTAAPPGYREALTMMITPPFPGVALGRTTSIASLAVT